MLEIINTITFVLFIFFMVASAYRITSRFFSYKRQNIKIPTLLKRDLWLILGLGYPLIGALLFRVLGIVPKDYDWYAFWVISSDIIGLSAIAQWAYYEYFVIDKSDE